MMKLIKAEIAKRQAITIVAIKRVFSKPLRSWCPTVNPSPPKPDPRPASDRCRRMAPTRRMERITWTYGNAVSITVIMEASIPKSYILATGLKKSWIYAKCMYSF